MEYKINNSQSSGNFSYLNPLYSEEKTSSYPIKFEVPFLGYKIARVNLPSPIAISIRKTYNSASGFLPKIYQGIGSFVNYIQGNTKEVILQRIRSGQCTEEQQNVLLKRYLLLRSNDINNKYASFEKAKGTPTFFDSYKEELQHKLDHLYEMLGEKLTIIPEANLKELENIAALITRDAVRITYLEGNKSKESSRVSTTATVMGGSGTKEEQLLNKRMMDNQKDFYAKIKAITKDVIYNSNFA